MAAELNQIIMNYSIPPSVDDLMVMTRTCLMALPEELAEFCNDVVINVEDVPDEVIEQDLELDDPYELLALYKSGKELAPGVETKTAGEDDVLTLYRRPILDMWCETHDDLTVLVRQVVIEELGRCFDFSDEEIEEMISRHHQGVF